MSRAAPGRVTVDVHLGPDDLRAALRRDAAAGLTARPKSMPPVWFYDERGCELYEAITRTPEYYPFRAERALLQAAAGDIARAAGAEVLVELGAGNAEKTRLLLDAMAAAPTGLSGYVPVDVAEGTLRRAAGEVARAHGVDVHAVVGDFHHHLGAVPEADGPRLLAFLGSTIGNLVPAERRAFLAEVAALLAPDDAFLLATDLVKPVERLEAAYDDAAGVTAAFNRNLLAVLDRELGADFDPAGFDHVARWVPSASWVELALRARWPMKVELPAIELVAEFEAGEELRTEVSTKFTPEQVRDELGAVGLEVVEAWTDPDGDYLVSLARHRR